MGQRFVRREILSMRNDIVRNNVYWRGYEGVRWIVDFKLSRHEGADAGAFLDREQERYRTQLETYAQVMREIDPRPIRVGLYFPLVPGWREWIPAL